MRLDDIRGMYEELGRDDPLWAVMTTGKYRKNRWDPAEFFATGKREITEAMAYLREAVEFSGGGRALDFGCGVGRLSQAMAGSFDEVVGVDISVPMVEKARRFADELSDPERLRFVVNQRPDLAQFEDASFDFVYSNKTLQHMPPRFSLAYVGEFMRVLRPGGLALFMIPLGRDYQPGSFGETLYRLRTERVRPWLKRLRGRPPIEMHYVAPARVQAILEEHGGRLVERVDLTPERHSRKRMRYLVASRALLTPGSAPSAP